jgi:hypothetical protein
MTYVPVVIVAGKPRPYVSGAGPKRQAERVCDVLAASYREVQLQGQQQGQPQTATCVGVWRDGRRVQ